MAITDAGIIQHGVIRARKRWKALRGPLPGPPRPTLGKYAMEVLGETVIERVKNYLPKNRTRKPVFGKLTLRETHGLESTLDKKVLYAGRGVQITAGALYRIHEDGGIIRPFRAKRLVFSVTPGKEVGEVGAEVRTAMEVRMPKRSFLRPSIIWTLGVGGKPQLERVLGRDFQRHFNTERA